MELGTSIMGLFAIALFVLPVVILNKSRKNKEKELLVGLNAMASSNNSHIEIVDYGMEFAIGLSKSKSLVFFYKKGKTQEVRTTIPLNQVQKCVPEYTKRKIRTKNGTESVIDKIELLFHFKDRGLESKRLEFFNSEEYSQINSEIELIEKWTSLINGSLAA
ncbi:hypothetical protein [Flagellimonas sediminis]|uniref:Uncharacterized protein n=1 Tax=Flagellimonas sediminis TaxID=2696468 RepID=A0A6I5KVV4_9FLAO|nr:hypothetical protein [Allomuricauda sediminis]NDV44105.1 hypothetical protein [Allomuricauda sediminis]